MWLIEKELKHPVNDKKLLQALKDLNIDFKEVIKRPFESINVSKWPHKDFDFVYVSTNVLLDLKDKIKGIYFNENNFSYKAWSLNYGDKLFNNPNESIITSFENVNISSLDDKNYYFVRPVKDLKSFSGTVLSINELNLFVNEVKNKKYSDLNNDVEIIIAPAYKIEKEWRCFIVDKKVSTASLYKKNGNLSISRKNIPEDMLSFAQDVAKIWSPEKIFTLDIGLLAGSYYIIEAQCANTSGFYDCDIHKLVSDINNLRK